MNAEDADTVHFMEIASHLGYLGYTVTPPPAGAMWYTASHPSRWNFVFARWRGFLWLRCIVSLPKGVTSDCPRALARVNQLRLDARMVTYHLNNDEGEHVIEAIAFLPITYERQDFGEWMLLWIDETSRISKTSFLDSVSEERAP